jgi:hypothetical protein
MAVIYKNATKGLISELGQMNTTQAPLEGSELEAAIVQMKESDLLVTSAIMRRILFILATQWEIIGDDSQQKQFVVDMAKDWSFELALRDILDRRFYGGHALIEKIWERDGGKWILQALRSIPFERYEMDELKEEVAILPDGGSRTLIDEKIFDLWTFGGPGMYGHGFLRKFYKMSKVISMLTYEIEPQLFWRFAAAFLHTALGPNDDTDKFRSNLDEFYRNPDFVAGISTGAETKLNWTQFDNNAIDHMIKTLAFKKDIIEVYVLGQTLTASIGASGSRAAAEVHKDVLFKVLQGDFMEIEAFMNRVIRQILELNFASPEKGIKFKYIVPEKADLVEITGVLPTLLKHGDGEISKKGVRELFGIPTAESEEDALEPGESLAQTFMGAMDEANTVEDDEGAAEGGADTATEESADEE